MRKLAIMAALASTALATPAVARDNSWYAGVEGGVMFVEDVELDFFTEFEDFDGDTVVIDVENALELDYNTGIDLDLVAGYDFGGFRVEAELGWKKAGLDEATINEAVFGETFSGEIDGNGRVLSAMVNGILDFGDDDGWGGYIGLGAGMARVKHKVEVGSDSVSDSDGGLAWQVVAGVRKAISENIDLGLKYRFFNAKYDYEDDSSGEIAELNSGRWRSHSLLLSLI